MVNQNQTKYIKKGWFPIIYCTGRFLEDWDIPTIYWYCYTDWNTNTFRYAWPGLNFLVIFINWCYKTRFGWYYFCDWAYHNGNLYGNDGEAYSSMRFRFDYWNERNLRRICASNYFKRWVQK